MSNVLRMKVLDAFCYLFEQLPALSLINTSVRIQILTVCLQRNTIDIFHDKVDLLGSFNKFDKFDDIRVTDLFKDSNLALYRFFLHRVSHSKLFINFQGKRVPCNLMVNESDCSICSLSNLAT